MARLLGLLRCFRRRFRRIPSHADEVIILFAFAFAFAIRHGHTAGDIRNTMFAYPTGASDLSHML